MSGQKDIIIKIPTEKQLEVMIDEEEQIRMSKHYQDECTKVKNVPNGWLKYTETMQEDLVKKHGFDDEISCDVACNRLRRARYIYPDNPKFKEPVYVRENKARKGDLKVGDDVPEIKIHKMDLNNDHVIDIREIMDDKKITVIFGGSHT